ncbi:MAG TPA: SPOR domain-containing protein [Methylomirabilota bacterium]
MATSVRRRVGSGPGTGQWMVLGGGFLVILVLTFALGLLVGRQWARPAPPVSSPSVSEAARKAATPPARRGGIAAETMADRAPEPTEKLTFYQTLTEPLAAQGASPRPEPKTVAIKPSPTSPAPPAPASTAPVAATPAPSGAALPPAQSKAAPAAPTAGPPWTIQVAAFKNRKQADDMRQQLASSGLEAYVATLAEGHARYRVRIGTFKSREEATAAAERLRGSRSLNVFVTLK